MIEPRSLGLVVVLAGLCLAGCEQTLRTGRAGNSRNAPSADGACPAGLSACGTGAFAQCLDLQNDRAHCGTCDNACTPGIACAAGVCQQAVCTSASVPLADEPGASNPGSMPYGAFSSVLWADVNGDGHLDLVDTSMYGGFHVSLGQPGGGFGSRATYQSSDVLSVSVGDVNTDGMDDLLVISSATPWIPPAQVAVWLGHPDGHLTRTKVTDQSATTNTIGAIDVAFGDISGDGLPDLLMPSHIGSSDIQVFLSDSTGELHLSSTLAAGGAFAALYVRDWNQDGSPDIGVRTVGPYTLKILYNRGDGTFHPPVDCGVYISIFGPDIVVEDVNGDGWIDLVMAMESGNRIQVALGLGACGFSPFGYYDVPGGGRLRAVRPADVNGDGRLDLVTVGTDGPTPSSDPPKDEVVGVLVGKADGTFEAQGTPLALGVGASDIADVAIGEVTGDDRPDILVYVGNGELRTLGNRCQ